MVLENEVIPEVLVSERAATVFKEACQAEGKNLEQSFLRIGAKPGGCSGWKYELEWNGPEDIHSEDLTLKSGEISVVVERECLTDILGPVKIDFTDKNLVEQGFVFEACERSPMRMRRILHSGSRPEKVPFLNPAVCWNC